MDNYIVVNFNMFTLNHSIFLIKNKETFKIGAYTLEDLPAALVYNCAKENEYNVKISGNKQYLDEFISMVSAEEALQYSENRIRIEVI